MLPHAINVCNRAHVGRPYLLDNMLLFSLNYLLNNLLNIREKGRKKWKVSQQQQQ